MASQINGSIPVAGSALAAGPLRSNFNLAKSEITDLQDEKQDNLVSGTNIKTVNNQSILGSGNISTALTAGASIDGNDIYIYVKRSNNSDPPTQTYSALRYGELFFRKEVNDTYTRGGSLFVGDGTMGPTGWQPYTRLVACGSQTLVSSSLTPILLPYGPSPGEVRSAVFGDGCYAMSQGTNGSCGSMTLVGISNSIQAPYNMDSANNASAALTAATFVGCYNSASVTRTSQSTSIYVHTVLGMGNNLYAASNTNYNTLVGSINSLGSTSAPAGFDNHVVIGHSNEVRSSGTANSNTLVGRSNRIVSQHINHSYNTLIGAQNELDSGSISTQNNLLIGKGNRTEGGGAGHQNCTLIGQNNTMSGSITPYGNQILGHDNRMDYNGAQYSYCTIVGGDNTLSGSLTLRGNLLLGGQNRMNSNSAVYTNTVLIGQNNRVGGSSARTPQDLVMIGRSNEWWDFQGGGFGRITSIGTYNQFHGSRTNYYNTIVVASGCYFSTNDARYDDNVFVGSSASCTPGASGSVYDMIVIGRANTFKEAYTFSYNTIIGTNNELHGRSDSSTYQNILLGQYNRWTSSSTFYRNNVMLGDYNVSEGDNSNVEQNVVIGSDNQFHAPNTSYRNNVFITRGGAYPGYMNLSYARNIFIGGLSASSRPGQDVIGIGHELVQPDPRPNQLQNAIAIGYQAELRNNTVQLGSSAVTECYWGNRTQQSFTFISDPRLKQNITEADIERCLADVNRLRVARFSYNDNFVGQGPDKVVTGFTTDNFRTVFPKAVSVSSYQGKDCVVEDCEAINPSQLIPTLVAAVQALTAQVEALRAG